MFGCATPPILWAAETGRANPCDNSTVGYTAALAIGLCVLVFGVVFLAGQSYFVGGALALTGVILLCIAYRRAGHD